VEGSQASVSQILLQMIKRKQMRNFQAQMQDYASKLEHTSKFSMMGEWMSTMVA
jgi:hypothetical protein